MMDRKRDIRIEAVALYFLPVTTRVPLKFGTEVLTAVTCARVWMRVRDAAGRSAEGWGETPLSVQWVWPSNLSCEARLRSMQEFCRLLAEGWAQSAYAGHPLEIGHDFQENELAGCWREYNAARMTGEPLPWLAALVCCAPFDLALHDAYGVLHGVPTYATYTRDWLSRDLAAFLEPADGRVSFRGRFPSDYLARTPSRRLWAWHLVGGQDPVTPAELTGREPDDGYPVLLRDWIRRDGLKCLKIKLRGNDAEWDYARLVAVGTLAVAEGVEWLSADFNCTVHDPEYVNAVLDRLALEQPQLSRMLLYVEQPFPYDLEKHQIDVHGVAARKPLFMDESAHDWRVIRLGRRLGWTGVALKTCKTQTGAVLSVCWAKAHGMPLMVQDLTNPMLAQIPHCLLAAHAETIMGVETNAMQFYPRASALEARVHPGLYERRGGCVDLGSLGPTGLGYRVAEIGRPLPPPVVAYGDR